MTLVPVPLAEVFDESRFGGKAVSLGQALRAGLPVPGGYGIEVGLVEALVASKDSERLVESFASLDGPVAIRSSAVGEDAKNASFAGQHVTVMNVRTPQEVAAAVRKVGLSAHTSSALAYRRKQGISGPPRIAVVMQRMVVPDVAGVLFTRDPLTGADERVVEASWGLGEVIVAGLVVPDSFRIGRDATIKERKAGVKDVMLRVTEGGGTEEIGIEGDCATKLSLNDDLLLDLNELAGRCELYYRSGYERGLDIEWAIERDRLFLLQCRPITRS